MTDSDRLGKFSIPDRLLRQAQARAQEATAEAKTAKAQIDQAAAPVSRFPFPGEWSDVAQFKGSNGTSIHTVSVRADVTTPSPEEIEVRCTCQGFRIQKKGRCKHTDRVREDIESNNKAGLVPRDWFHKNVRI